MPDSVKIPKPEEYFGNEKKAIPSPDDYFGLKKKEPLEAGLEPGSPKLPTPEQVSGLLPGYQSIIQKGKIPTNPFEKDTLGQPAIDDPQALAYTGKTPKQQVPKKQASIYDQALEDTEKWYGGWPSPREKIMAFNKAAHEIKAKYESGSITGTEEEIQFAYSKELADAADKEGLLAVMEGGLFKDVKVTQGEIDKYEETYKRKLDARLSQVADRKKNSYVKDVLGNLGTGSAQVLATPYNLMAISEKAGNAMLGLVGVDPSTYWQDFSKYLSDNQGEMAENSRRYDEDIISLAKNGETGKAIGSAVLQTAQTLPMLATLIMGNAAGATNKALAFMGTSTAAQTYMANNDKKDIGEFYKIVEALGAGLAEVAFEQAGTVKILEGIKKGIQERGANVVQEELTNMLRTNMERNVAMIMQGNSDMVREGLSEGMTSLAQNIMAKATTNPDQDIWEGVTDATIVGALIGKGINLTLNTANKVQTSGARASIRNALKQIPENYSIETKEELTPLLIERDALASITENAAKPIQELYKPRIDAIDKKTMEIAAKEEGIDLPEEEAPKEGEKKPKEEPLPKSDVTLSSTGINEIGKPDDVKKPIDEVSVKEGIVIGEKTEATPSMKRILDTGEENVFTRKIEKDGTEFGEITIEEKPDGWQVKRVDVNEEKKGFGKQVYRMMNEEAQKEGKVVISDLPDKISNKAQGMWNSLVKSGEAIKNEDGSYQMLPKKEEAKIPKDIESRMKEIEKIVNENGYGLEIEPDNDPDMTTVNVRQGENIVPDEEIPQGMKDLINEFITLTHEAGITNLEEEPDNASEIRKTKGQTDQAGNEPAKGEGNISQEVQPGKESGTKAGNEKERLNLHNRVVGLVDSYNAIPKAHTRKRADAFKEINSVVSRLGYSVSQKDGKISIINKGKPIRRVQVKRTEEEIQSHKSLPEYEDQEFVSFVNLVNQMPENFIGLYDTGLKKTDIPKAVKDITEGKKSAAANDFLDYLGGVYENGEIKFYDPGTKTTFQIPLDDFIKSIQESEEVAGEQPETIYTDQEINDMMDAYYEGRIEDEEFEKIRNELFSDNVFPPEDFEPFKQQYDENREPEEGDEPVETGGEISEVESEVPAKDGEAEEVEMEENAFAQPKKGKKTPPSKDKGITKPTPGKTRTETKEPPQGPWIDEDKMTNEGLKGIEAPELVEMFRKLTGKFPLLKKFKEKLGVFYHFEGGDFNIALNRILFTKDGIGMLAKVIAHEFGHFVDSIPGMTTKRGNILGRIASLKDYFVNTLGEKPGKEDTVLTDKDRAYLRAEAKRSLKEEYDAGIREIVEEIFIEEPIFEEAGLTAQDVIDIWIDNMAREKNPELYEYIARLSSFQKKKVMADALKGLIDSELVKKFSKGKQIGTKVTKQTIKKVVTPKPVTPQSIAEKYRELLKQEINKRRLFEVELITEELKALTRWWNPFDPKDDKSYTDYRYSSVELYAEALSVLFNNPQALAERAPFFNRAFFNYFENKPTIKQVYDEIQDLLSKPRSELLLDRLRRVFEGFRKGEKKRYDIANLKRKDKLSRWESVQQALLSLIIPIVKKIPEGRTLQMALNARQYLRDALEKLAFANEKVAVMLVKMEENINKQLEESGLTMDDFSAMLMVNRNINQRTEIANPYAFQQREAAELKAFMEERFSQEQQEAMDRILKNFHAMAFDIINKGHKAGMYSQEQFETIQKYKDTYATYQVVDYIFKNSIAASFKHATGTIKEIESPFVSTLFKLASIIRGTERQTAVNTLIYTYDEFLPGEIKETEQKRVRGVAVGFKPAEGKESVEYWKDGKWSSIDVDPYVAKFFSLENIQKLDPVTNIFRTFNKGFKPIVTTWNVGWAFFSNVFRDHPRTYYNLFAILGSVQGVSKLELAKLPFTYLKSLYKVMPIPFVKSGDAKKFVEGELTPLIEEMINQGVLRHGFFGSYDPYADEPVGPIYQKYGLIQKDKSLRDKMAERSKLLKFGLSILSGIEYGGQILEVSSKMVAFDILERKLKDARSAGFYTRNYAGTPNYLDKGTLTRTTNEIWTFSNVILQALRTDAEIAFKPQTRGAFWTAQAISVATPAALMALAAAGLFGDELEDLYGQLTEYEKTNYLCVIWGSTSDGKPIYTRFPIPEFSRVTHGITYKTLSIAMGRDGLDAKDLGQILSLGTSMTPSLSPLIKTASGVGSYIMGQNPYDKFYGRNVLTEREQEARGLPAIKKMVTWSIKNVGGSWLVKFYDYDPLKNTTTEYIMQNIPLVSRMVKIGGYGQAETLSKAGQKVRSDRAKQSLKTDKVITEYVLKALSEGKDYSNADDVLNELKIEIYGSPNLDSEQKREFSYTRRKFKTKLIKGVHSPFSNAVNSMIDSQSNDEKIAKMQQYALIYGEDKLSELLGYMKDQELISDALRKKIRSMVEGIDTDEQKRNIIIQALESQEGVEYIPSESITGEGIPTEEIE